MNKRTIALVEGDGSAPEMMRVACRIATHAAAHDGINIEFAQAPMGWSAYDKEGEADTLPKASLATALKAGIVFFGGVGDPKYDTTIGAEHPHLKPEARCLLPLREQMGLLLNFRPMIFHKPLAHLANVRPERIPESGVQQIWIRYLLEDSYFGNSWLLRNRPDIADQIGVKKKADITGDEAYVTDVSFYTQEMLTRYMHAAFTEARKRGLPLISIDKANVMSRYDFWRKLATRMGSEEFPDVPLVHQLVDSANALLFNPASLHGVIACGNEHGDILSDGAAGALGSMGLMCSSSINPITDEAMFESGAGTAPTLAGQDKANPIGRVLTAAMMLRHIGAETGARYVEVAVQNVLKDGWRTGDLVVEGDGTDPARIVGTSGMGDLIIEQFHWLAKANA